jgi:uncharacterized protein
MHIWVDADACPKPIREILFRAAERTAIPLTLVANQPLSIPRSRWIRTVRVAAGFDVADQHIAERVTAVDLVITQDIPLAAAVVRKGAVALSPRGERFTEDNVGQRLSMRNFMDELRGAGIQTGGPAAPGPAERKAFADALDHWLSRALSAPAARTTLQSGPQDASQNAVSLGDRTG